MRIQLNIGTRPIRSVAAGGFAVAMGLHFVVPGWHFDACWPYTAQGAVCTIAVPEAPHGHDPEPNGGGRTKAAIERTMSGTSTDT